MKRREANLRVAFAEHGIPWLIQRPMTDAEAARYIAHTHPLIRQSDEKPEDFVLRIVRAYDNVKSSDFPSAALSRPKGSK